MRGEVLESIFWLLILGGWVVGVCCGYWMGGDLSHELSLVTGVPPPSELEGWWEPLLFFSLTPLSCYLLSQLFFGGAAPFLLFLRGTHDGGVLIRSLEASLSGFSFPNLPSQNLLSSLFLLLILSVNLPLCLWASHLGVSRALYVRRRILGKAVRAGEGSSTLSSLFLLLALSLVAGLLASFLFGYM
jgi:hypothetical protein